MEYLTMTIREQKNIALIAHDGKKQEMLQWCIANREILKKHHLCGTGTTARMITEQAGLSVKGYNSGPLGGDQQVGAKIVEGQIDMVIFFSDPLTAQPHDPDVKALLRIAQVYDIPIANNKATADFLMHSTFMIPAMSIRWKISNRRWSIVQQHYKQHYNKKKYDRMHHLAAIRIWREL